MARIETVTNFREWRPSNLSGGLCLEDLEWKIKDNQSPSMLNVWYNDRIITKRMGQEYVNNVAVADSPILGIYGRLFKTYIVFTCSTKMYKLDPATGAATEIMSGLTASSGRFFLFNDILYYINGAQYIKWTGTGSATAVVGYVPVVVINRDPSGSPSAGDANENYNRISAGFTTWFDGDNAATDYTLPQTGLDDTLVTATVDGVAKVETTDFTVDRATGVVTFTSGTPPTGTNNVRITAYKTDSALVTTITSCKHVINFGGDNQGTEGGTRVFLANPTSNHAYWCGLNDPTYFPDGNYNLVGSNDGGITGFGIQYGVLVVFKPTEIYGMEYSFDGSIVRFPTRQINASIGCDCPSTIQLIDNRLVWCNSYGGAYILDSTNIQDERNVKPISQNINGTKIRPGLMAETVANLQAASSVDMFGKYWLCVGSKAYLWDYAVAPYVSTGDTYADERRLSWWYFESINANCWTVNESELYYGDRTTGKIIHFKDDFYDFGGAITARWKPTLNSFGAPDWLKTVYEMWVTTRTSTYTQMQILYYTNETGESEPVEDSEPIIAGSYSWDTTTWDTGTWDVINYLKTFKRKPKLKKITVFSPEFKNSQAGRDLAISDLVVKYKFDRRVK